MAIPLTINGAVFQYPEDFDENWGVDATGWAQAVTNGMLQMAGGSFPITANINFGPNFGLLAKYFETRSANPATTGTVRLSSADAGIVFRNNANSGNLVLTTNSSDELLYNGSVVASVGGGVVTSLTATANQTTVSAATGAVVVGTVQNIATSSTPSFVGLNLTATVTQLVLGTGNQVGISAPTPAAARLYTVPDTGTSTSSFIMADGAQTINGVKTYSTPIAVGSGGTGASTLTAYAVLCGGTTSTNPIQSIAGVGTSGQVLTSNGASALPTFQSSPILNNPTLSSLNSSFFGLGRNRILNGEMRFDQKNEGANYSSSDHLAHYNLDQWRHEGTGAAEFTVNRLAAGPNNFFSNTMQIITTVAASPAAADGVNMEYPMDPVYQRDWAWGTADAVTITIQFWALCTKAGTFSLAFINGVNSRSYVTTYTISAPLAWQHFSITVPGDVTAPQSNWPTSGQVFGLKVVWDLGSGSNVVTSTLNAWQAGSVWRASGSTGIVEAPAATLDLTGVQLEIGSVATSYEYRPYELELALLQKYQYKTFPQGTRCLSGQGYAGSLGYVVQIASTTAGNGVNLSFPTTMLATPSISYFNPIISGANFDWYNNTLATDSGLATSGVNVSATNVLAINPQVAGDAVGNKLYVQLLAQALLGGP